jgi:Transposase DDE domain
MRYEFSGKLSSVHQACINPNLEFGRLGLAAGEAHDNRLADKLLSRLRSGTMLLADRGYDADWIRALAVQRGAWANIPPRCNRSEPICFSPYLYRPGIWSSGSSIRSSSVAGSQRVTISSPPTTSPSSSLHQSGFGCALMSSRPNQIL